MNDYYMQLKPQIFLVICMNSISV